MDNPVTSFADLLAVLWGGRGAPLGTLWVKRADRSHSDWLALDAAPPSGARQLADAAHMVESYRDHADVYYGVHPQVRIPDGTPRHVRSRIENTHSIACLFAEYDAKATGETLDALLDRLRTTVWAAAWPSLVIESGGGYHAYWFLAEPLIIAGDRDALDRAKRVQAGWVRVMGGDDGAKDLARVLRVPDTWNHKYDAPRLVRIIDGNGTRHRLDALEAIIAAATPAPPSSPPSAPLAAPTPAPVVAGHTVDDRRNAAYADKTLRNIAAELASATEGGRNNALNDYAFRVGQLVGGGIIDLGQAEVALADGRTTAAGLGLDAREIERTIQSGYAGGQRKPQAPLPDRPPPERPRPVAAHDAAGQGVEAEVVDAADARQRGRLRPAPTIRVRGMAYDDPELDAQSKIQWLIEKWVGVQMLSVLTGAGGSGKSTLALTMALLATRHATVAWIPAEGAQEWPMRARVQADYLRRQGVGGIDPGKVLIYNARQGADGQLENPGLNLLDAASRRAYTDALRADGVRFVILDAWAGHLALAGLDENDASETGQALVGVNEMITELSAAALIISHSGKGGNGIRGSARLRDEARVVVEATLTGETMKLRCDKANNGKPFDTLMLTMTMWSAAHNGQAVDAPVLRHYSAPVTKGAPSGDEIELLRRLTWADHEDGATTADLVDAFDKAIARETLVGRLDRCVTRGHVAKVRKADAGMKGKGVLWKITPDGREAIERAEEMGGVAAASASPALLPGGNPALFVVQPLTPLPALAAVASDNHDAITAESRSNHGAITAESRSNHGGITEQSRRNHGAITESPQATDGSAMQNDGEQSRSNHDTITNHHEAITTGGQMYTSAHVVIRDPDESATDAPPDGLRDASTPERDAEHVWAGVVDALPAELLAWLSAAAKDDDADDGLAAWLRRIPPDGSPPRGGSGGDTSSPGGSSSSPWLPPGNRTPSGDTSSPGAAASATMPTSTIVDAEHAAWRADPDRWWARYAKPDAPRERVSIRRGVTEREDVFIVCNNSGLGVLPGTHLEGYTSADAARAAARAAGVEPSQRISPVLLPVADWYAPIEGE